MIFCGDWSHLKRWLEFDGGESYGARISRVVGARTEKTLRMFQYPKGFIINAGDVNRYTGCHLVWNIGSGDHVKSVIHMDNLPGNGRRQIAG